MIELGQLWEKVALYMCSMLMHANDRHITMSLPFGVFVRKKRKCSTFCPKRVGSGKSQRKDFIAKYVILLLWIYTKENRCKSMQTVHYDYSTTRNTKYVLLIIIIIIIQRMVKQYDWLQETSFMCRQTKEQKIIIIKKWNLYKFKTHSLFTVHCSFFMLILSNMKIVM